MKEKSKSLPWDEVEKAIREEIGWLRNNIDTFLKEEVGTPISCRDCLMREIAILILSGKIKATDIKKKESLVNFWDPRPVRLRKRIHHGGEWHKKKMEEIESHFRRQKFKVIREPNLHWGRADLGIFKKGVRDLYVEVGTTTFFKLCINLKAMRNCVYLIVPNDEKLIEFRCF